MTKIVELLEEAVRLLKEKECSMGTVAYEDSDSKVELSTLYPGETFKIGEHDFIVLEQAQDRTMVISKGFMAEDVVFDRNSRDYNTSNLKRVIEDEIQPIIEVAVGAENLVEEVVDLTTVDMQSEFCSLSCKVRPLTFDEARKYNDLIADKSLGDWWWTCTPWSTSERGWDYSIAVVSSSGLISRSSCHYYRGVRPFCILKSNIFVSKGV